MNVKYLLVIIFIAVAAVSVATGQTISLSISSTGDALDDFFEFLCTGHFGFVPNEVMQFGQILFNIYVASPALEQLRRDPVFGASLDTLSTRILLA